MSFNKPAYDFAKRWGDSDAVNSFRSNKGKEVQLAEAENYLRDMATRFERQPNSFTIQAWARDIIESGYNDVQLKEVCRTIPFKFEKCPTLAQIMELLRPYKALKEEFVSDLDKYTNLAFKTALKQFKRVIDDEPLERLVEYYRKEVLNAEKWDYQLVLMCVVNDWIRANFPMHPAKIIEQGKNTNEQASIGNVDYILNPLKRYCANIENSLQDM